MASLYSIRRNERPKSLVNFFLNTDDKMEHIRISEYILIKKKEKKVKESPHGTNLDGPW